MTDYPAKAHAKGTIEHPAEPVIEVAPGEQPCREVCGSNEVWTPESGCKCHPPAVPAQEAEPCSGVCGSHEVWTPERGCSCHPPSNPQAGAQVPSQDEEYQRELVRYCGDDFTMQAGFQRGWLVAQRKLDHIRNYATEAAKTPITRESILAAPQVEPYPMLELQKAAEAYAIALRKHDVDDDGELGEETLNSLEEEFHEACANRFGANHRLSDPTALAVAQLIERITTLESALEARKLTELAQYDEMQGLCRLILSETK